MKIQGWASTVDIDHSGHVILPSAYASTLAVRGITGPQGVKLLAYHDFQMGIGTITKLEIRNRGLWLEGEIETKISYAKDLALAVKAAGGYSFSVGFLPIDADVNDDGVLVISKVNLYEVSIVPRPANDAAIMLPVNGEFKSLDAYQALRTQLNQLTAALKG